MPGQRRWARVVVRRRRPLAALLTGLSVLLLVPALRPAPAGRASHGQTTQVLVAAHNLAAGTVLRDADVRAVAYPSGLVPDGAMAVNASLAGRRLALPVRAGELLTDARFLASGLLDQLSGPNSVAAPVRVADAGELALVRPGNRVDVLATPTSDAGNDQTASRTAADAEAVTIASGAVVLSVPPAATTSAVTDGGLVVLAVPAETARALAGAAAADRLSLVLRP